MFVFGIEVCYNPTICAHVSAEIPYISRFICRSIEVMQISREPDSGMRYRVTDNSEVFYHAGAF